MQPMASEFSGEIDISRQARVLFFLRTADFTLVVVSGLMLVGCLSAFITIPSLTIGDSIAFPIAAVIILFCLVTGYRHFGVINDRGWLTHLAAFSLLLLLCALSILSTTLQIVQQVDNKNALSENFASAILEIVMGLWATFACAYGIVCVFLLRMLRIKPLGVTLKELLSTFKKKRSRPVPIRVKRVNVRAGIRSALFGGALLLASFFVTGREIGFAFGIFGVVLLLKARRYFQATAESLLGIDQRNPILFLRSFEDDRYGPSFWFPLISLLDFSLETRLSNHFSHFGPFIAAGSPKEPVPALGAARLTLPDADWQARVTGWIEQANLIVMYVGRTDWVSWELGKVIAADRLSKLILLLPEGSHQVIRRFERIRDLFKPTIWSRSLEVLQQFHTVRALLFRNDGSLVVIRSRSINRDSYHLAALLAHFIVLNESSSSTKTVGQGSDSVIS